MPGEHLHDNGMPNIKASRAPGYDTLYLNLNGDGKFVKFPHQAHIDWIKMFEPSEINSNVFHNDSTVSNDSCFMCHHLKLPGEKLSACSECHSSMYQQVDFFNHDWHKTNQMVDLKCNDCHKVGINRNAQSAKSCTACHQTYKFASNKNTFNNDYYILSYKDALHRLCEYCHTIE